MTICIAAVCRHEEKAALAVAADHMITASFGPYTLEFEHENSKFQFLNKSTVLFFAGDSLFPREILPALLPTVQKLKTTDEMAKKTAELTEQERLKRIEEQVFLPRKTTIEKFYGGDIQKFPPQLAAVIDQALLTSSLNVEMLMAGIDGSGAHIFQISDRMRKSNYDGIGFSAIGSGAIHAISSLVAQRYSPNCRASSAVYYVYTAKRKAEAAPGVGNKITDMKLITIDETKGINCQELDNIYDDEQKRLESFYQNVDGTNLQELMKNE